jgi:hypothetical protein
MKMEDKPYGINFELGVYLQIVLWLENIIANYLQLEGSFYILYFYFYFCKLHDSISKLRPKKRVQNQINHLTIKYTYVESNAMPF